VLPAIGEEFGYAGVLTIGLLFVFLFHPALAAARSAADEYGFFLALGFGALIAFEMLLISLACWAFCRYRESCRHS